MNILAFSAADIVSILQLGISGVAFVFLAMSFILLRKEQDREQKPREAILESIKSFSRMCLIFAILVAALSIFEKTYDSSVTLPKKCLEAISRAEVLSSNKEGHTLETISSLLQTTISQCK